MKNILLNKKWLNIIALLLLVISLSSCSELVEVTSDGDDGIFSLLFSIWKLYLLFLFAYSIYIVFVSLTGYYLNREKIMIDGKVHTIETFEETNARKLGFDEILEMIFVVIFKKSISIVLGCTLSILVYMMTGKINIWLDFLIIGLSQYVSYLFVKKNPTIVKGLFYVIIVSLVIALVVGIIVGINMVYG